MAVSSELGLDKPFSTMSLGANITVVATVIFRCPGATVCRTTINQQDFITDAKMDKNATMVTLMDFQLTSISGKTWLLTNCKSKILQHLPHSTDGMKQLVEGCSGLGAVGKGFHELGFHTVAYAETNQKFASWLIQQGYPQVINGDISQNEVIHKIGQRCTAGPPTVTAGVSCQPFSLLGDRKERFDPRSESMPAAIRLGFLLNSPLIILECTPAARTSKWVQNLLQEFQKDTSYQVDQIILEMHHLWPTHRSRWWAIISHPMFRLQPIPKMPSIGWSPSIMHLIPNFLHLTKLELDQLELTPYELRLFHANAKGIASSIVNMAKSMPTATHSWGSQLLPCACGCRKGGFTKERLDQKGLYGILIPLGTEMTLDGVELSCMRHPHPEEIAILNGLDPQYIRDLKSTELRLLLAGVGQLGSPLQSGWVISNILRQIERWGTDTIDPHQIIRRMCKDLFQARDEKWNQPKPTRYMDIFHEAIEKLGEKQERTANEENTALTQAILDKVKQVEQQEPLERKPIPPDSSEIPMPPFQNISFDVAQPKIANETTKNDLLQHHKNRPEEFQPDPHVLDRWCEKEGTLGGGTDTNSTTAAAVYAPTGGIMSFSSKRSSEVLQSEEHDQSRTKQHKGQDKQAHNPSIEATATWTQPAMETMENEQEVKEKTRHAWIGHENHPLYMIKFAGEPTVGQATQAEAKLLGIGQHQSSLTAMGNNLSMSKTLENEEILLIRPIGSVGKGDCKRVRMQANHCNNQPAPDLSHLTRLDGLWHQMGWVAKDEMTFYLRTVKEQCKIMTTTPIILAFEPENPMIWGKWIVQGTEIAAAANRSYKVSTVCWHDHHWFPICLEVLDGAISITTTPVDSDFLHNLSKQAFGDYDFILQTFDIQHKFPVDCGYQSIAWIMGLHDDRNDQTWFEEEQAIHWKQMFSQHLIEQGLADQQCRDLKLGGMNPTIVLGELQTLLEQHGVKPQRSATHAQHIISKLSIAEVIKTLQAPRPWQDLKSKANAQTPTIQLVHSDELKQMIDNRLKNGKQMGSKQNKLSIQKKPQTAFQLNASQIQVPPGIFQQTDGTHLQQLKTMQIQQNAQGFAVVNANEAKPFFELQDRISKSGLALLILDHQHPDIKGKCECIRFPAQYTDTDEPVIVTAALLQLGHQEVIRHKPDTCTRIEETTTSVLRILVYRDLYQEHEWSDFHSKPVKCIMELESFARMPSHSVIDVWDRQFLGKNFKKVKAAEADIFLVTIRIEQTQASTILNMSGNSGIFVEPRDDSGRHPSDIYRVIWLPKKTYSDMIVVKQTTNVPCWIVRSGDRYGLRVEMTHVKEVHNSLRPEIDYLDGDLKTYRLGPLPFGTTKSSLSKVFKQWGWSARPGQPLTQSRDHSGIFWSCQANSSPTHWIFTMEHGDILISEEPTKEDNIRGIQTVVASKRTIQHITSMQNGTERSGNDPWLEKDPWTQASASSKPMSASQISNMENAIERRIRDSLQQQQETNISMAVDTDNDQRMTQIEQQMHQMQSNFNSFQSQQQAHNRQVASEITNVKTQMEVQTQSFQQILSKQLEDQMSKIDALLLKRPRQGE